MAEEEKKQKIAKKEETEPSYTAKDIYVLEGLDPVRKRPGMYIGSTGIDGLHHLIWEVVDNSIDEAMAGYAKNIEVRLLKDNVVSVLDDGRGIPVDIHKQTKKSALETVLTTLHAGGKFGGESYKVSGGLHGVGVSVVNALSIWLKVEVCREGGLYAQEYERGKPKFAVKKIGKCEQKGTKVIFSPDPQIFQKIEFDKKKILDHLREQSYLTKGIRIFFVDERSDKPYYYGFRFDGGIKSFIGYLNEGGDKVIHDNIFYVEKEYEGIGIEVAVNYNEGIETAEFSFANNIHTTDGGMHLTGFKSALTRTLNDYARANNYLKEKEENITGDDTREGLVAIISIKLREPQFEGQTKARLGNPESRTAVEAVMNETFREFLETHPSDAGKIVEKVLLAAKARKAAKAAKETILRKGVLEGLTLPGKLADCQTRKAEESELFIVEGDSAGGCFFGNTKVALTDGRKISFKELVEEDKQGKKNFCYTIKNDGNIGMELIKNPRKTKNNAEVIKIILDNNEELICTPDHKFMLRDGSYKTAKDLKSEDSLMPLYRKYSKIENRITIEGYEMILNPQNSKWIFTHLLADQYKFKNDKSLIRYDTICQSFFDGNENKLKEAVVNYNHRIKTIIPLKEKVDVYDLEVLETHNFALASGIFVHNSAKQGRDRRTQAILPLRGKILNVEKARIDKMLANKEIRSLIIALGTAIAEEFDLTKLRYHKTIIMTDADVDGAHIRTLLLSLFYRHFRPIIDGGYLYIATPPLYRVQSGKTFKYAYTDDEKEKIIQEFSVPARDGSATGGKTANLNIQRYKGLGEMNPDQLWETTMNPETRILKQVNIEDAIEADKLIDILMGSEVMPRKHFIMSRGHLVGNLDI